MNNIKIGLVIATYDSIDFVEKCLAPWIEHRKNGNLLISIIDGRFLGFPGVTQNSNDGSLEILDSYLDDNKIDYLFKSSLDRSEHETRNLALGPLLELDECTHIISWGIDELINPKEINSLFSYIEKNPEIAVFSINYKNLIWDNQYLEGFCPRRVWATKIMDYTLQGFNYDDDCYYQSPDGTKIQDIQLPGIKIPKNKLFVEHHTWNDLDRSIQKISYQNSRPGWLCSFEYKNGKIDFCEAYYKKHNIPKPEIFINEN